MFDLGALWMPIKYDIPMLIFMYNNRAYYNDWAHQIHMAHQRGTDPARAYIGMDLEAPPPDFAHIAKGIGWYSEGPIEDPAEVGPALKPRHRASESRQACAGRRDRLAPRRKRVDKDIYYEVHEGHEEDIPRSANSQSLESFHAGAAACAKNFFWCPSCPSC